MRQLFAIAKNAFLQTIRQPTYGIIVLVTLAALCLSPSITGWTLDDDNKMLRDLGLSTLLIQGLFLACFAASSVVNTEIEDKTALTTAAKPVSRFRYISGKFLGVLGALLAAHYLAGIAFFMTLRHGVLQNAAETSDPTVLIMGPGVMLLVLLAAAILNYVYDSRFLPTVIYLSLPCMTLSTAILLLVDRDWKIQTWEITQTMDDLPPELVDTTVLKNMIEFRPLAGEARIEGHRGLLVRDALKGPITGEERSYLMGLSGSLQWKKDVDYLVQESKKLQGTEIFKAGILVFVAVSLIGSIAIAVSTRLGMVATLVISLLAVSAGLAADQVIKPIAEAGRTWAILAYRAVPNFQCFWMVDALSEDRVIPWDYLISATGYGVLYMLAMLMLGAALFETREVG